MKKLIAVLLVSLLICPATMAEGIDLTAMSTDELLTLREQLNAEIIARTGPDSAVIGRGVYYVGETLKASSYELTCVERNNDALYFWVEVYNSAQDFEAGKVAFNCGQMVLGSVTTLTISDGMVVKIKNGSGTLRALEKPDWMP